MLQCAEASMLAQEELDTRWPALQAMAVPQDLYAAMVGHQGACNDMLSLKDDVISKMRDVLAKKEVEHVRILKNHAEVRPRCMAAGFPVT